MSDGFGLVWRVSFVCGEKPGLLRRESPAVISALAKSPLWSELQVYGASSAYDRAAPLAKAIKGVAGLKTLVKQGGSLFLARGDHNAFREPAGSDLRVSISPSETGIALRAEIRGGTLERLRLAAIDACAEMLADLAVRFRSQGGRMTEACAFPARRSPPFEYPRIRPPRVTRPFRQANAIVDVLDTCIPDSTKHPETRAATCALATAALPAGVTRRVRDGVVIQRWVEDPCDEAEAARAAAAHERWLYEHLPSTPAPGYNDAGDLRMPRHEEPAPIGLDLLTYEPGDPNVYYGHVSVAASLQVPSSRELPNGKRLTQLCALAASRDHALAVLEAARAAGFDRVVYRGEDGALWDPAPPGLWADPVS